MDIVTGPDGNLWFTEASSQFGAFKIGRLSVNGTLTEFSAGSITGAQAIVAGPDGNLWSARYVEAPRGFAVDGEIDRITTLGVITQFSSVGGPRGITAGADGNLWFTNWLNAFGAGEIARMTTGGVITRYPIPTANSGPYGIVAGPDGNVWFTQINASKIGRVTPEGSVTEFPLLAVNRLPFRIVLGPDNAFWFTERDSTGNVDLIARMTLSGSVTEFPVPTPGAFVEHITAGPDGNLWFTETGANKIGRITPDGSITEFTVPTPHSAPRDITSGPDGNIWFTEANNNQLGRVTIGLFLGSPGRFRAAVAWSTQDNTGVGNAHPITSNTGAFWFFDPSNLELVVKVLDGRSVNGKWWVFYGSLTNVEFTLTVTDTQTGAVKTYVNPQGRLASVADTSAF